MSNPVYLAHVKRDESSPEQWRLHHLEAHLYRVAQLSADYTRSFEQGFTPNWAYLAGLWHDLGKYRKAFQQRIKLLNGYDVEAHLEGTPDRVNHSSAGALHAFQCLHKDQAKILGYMIAGHHTGLPDWVGELDRRLALDMEGNQRLYQEAIQEAIPAEIINPDQMKLLVPAACANPNDQNPDGHKLAPSFWIRMMFSCLVDADFLDTEAFMEPEKQSARQQCVSLNELKSVFDAYMSHKQSTSPATPVNQIRRQILEACLAKAKHSSGLYTLTAPTGGGKTLSSIAFALAHAVHHHKERIIYVLPYTSIIEQTAAVLKSVFSDIPGEYMIEHHSTVDPERETLHSRLATENWDAPIILTTNVQFFESLFANRSSRCRKLHNIANSVVILDEAQQISLDYKEPIEGALFLLSQHYQTTVVLSTATQPVLLDPKVRIVDNLVPEPEKLYQALKRVSVQLPANWNEPVSWEGLSEELTSHEQVLCIVNRRDDALHLFQQMPSGTFHLSALMCAAHRSQVIAEIKQQLEIEGSIVRVISTQLVEAGVDMDFPVVYRAVAGLDSIAQAAGRCNREGRLAGLGQVKVFVPPTSPHERILQKAAAISKEMLLGEDSVELDPALLQQYFKMLYASVNSLDKKGIIKLLEMNDGKPHFQFKQVAKEFQLIEDPYDFTVFIPWDASVERLLEAIKHQGPSRMQIRQLQRYSVSIHKPDGKKRLENGEVLEIHPGLYRLRELSLYDLQTGLSSHE